MFTAADFDAIFTFINETNGRHIHLQYQKKKLDVQAFLFSRILLQIIISGLGQI